MRSICESSPLLPPAASIHVETKPENAERPIRRIVRPSQALMRRLGSPARVIGIDIETHDFDPHERARARYGQFAWYTLKDRSVIERTRLVQIGWATGPADATAPSTTKSFFVQPSGFEVAERIETWSEGKITHAIATEKGRPLAEVLQEFMVDIMDEYARGARVVSHHFEYDAGIILCELERAGLRDLSERWLSIGRSVGYCTMNYEAGRWLLLCEGMVDKGLTWKPCLALSTVVSKLFPNEKEELLAEHHEAGADAKLARLVYLTLVDRTKVAAATT